MKHPRPNPFQTIGGDWWWYDEQDQPVGPYTTQIAALRGLLEYIDPPTWFEKLTRIFR
jgi:hypothetical protein